jgi:hypothetical protein
MMKRNRIVAFGSRLALATTVAAVASLVLACASSYPSESAARTALENLGNSPTMGGNWFKVKSFTKTNGKGDDKNYTVEYDAELECGPIPPNTILPDDQDVPHVWKCYGQSGGRIIKVSGMIAFEKTEKGWQGPDKKIY